MSEQVNDFFVTDTRDFAPYKAEMPDRELVVKAGLWTDLLITYTENELTYASKVSSYVYRVPLRTPADQAEGIRQNGQIISRLISLVIWGCIHTVEWRFLSQPPIDIAEEVPRISVFLALGKLAGITRLEFEITGNAGKRLDTALEKVMKPTRYVEDMQLTFRRGDFSESGPAFQIVKSLDILSGKELEFTKLHVEISKIGVAGRRELERVSPVIESITVDRLTSKSVCDHLIQFIRHTKKDLKIYINSFEIRGETTIHVPRGNLSLSIKSISSKSTVFLSCYEQLACLTVSESTAKRLSGPELDVGELQVMGKPSAALLERITARFAKVNIVTTGN
ncbi:hypothetical protein TRVA0_009S01552 [Trichomonascus vanleenenianus]|uniref:uncharacterized protein n=1 Tax=Trichomonascus vanleenenianus TaxID=2268995 RepID=UPI003ECA484A